MNSKKTYKLSFLAKKLGVQFYGDPDYEVDGVATIQDATPSKLSFLANEKYQKFFSNSQAGIIIVKKNYSDTSDKNLLIASDPYHAYAQLSSLFLDVEAPSLSIHETAVIGEHCSIGRNVTIGPYVVVESNVVLGDNVMIGAQSFIGRNTKIKANSKLGPRVTIYDHVSIGVNAIVHSGVVIGADGFGFAKNNGKWDKVSQLGGVTIDDDVEIGANTTIDRGSISDTIIGKGVKLDNQIMIAHNVEVGDYTAIAACCGISGSSKIGKYCMLAGGVGLVGHIEICDNVFITGMTMVTRSIYEPGSYSSGTAMQSASEWKKNIVRIRQLDNLARKINKIEKKLS